MYDKFFGVVGQWCLGDSQSKRLLFPSELDCKTNRTHFGHGYGEIKQVPTRKLLPYLLAYESTRRCSTGFWENGQYLQQ